MIGNAMSKLNCLESNNVIDKRTPYVMPGVPSSHKKPTTVVGEPLIQNFLTDTYCCEDQKNLTTDQNNQPVKLVKEENRLCLML